MRACVYVLFQNHGHSSVLVGFLCNQEFERNNWLSLVSDNRLIIFFLLCLFQLNWNGEGCAGSRDRTQPFWQPCKSLSVSSFLSLSWVVEKCVYDLFLCSYFYREQRCL